MMNVINSTHPSVPGISSDGCNCAQLRKASRRVTRLYDDALAPIGLGANQYSILAQLNQTGSSAIGDLAGLLVMDRSTLGHLLRPLEKRRLVKLDASDQDGRSRIAELTPAGRALVANGRPLWERAQQRFAKAVGEDDAIELRTVLTRVANAAF